jgi:hypothetical protein
MYTYICIHVYYKLYTYVYNCGCIYASTIVMRYRNALSLLKSINNENYLTIYPREISYIHLIVYIRHTWCRAVQLYMLNMCKDILYILLYIYGFREIYFAQKLWLARATYSYTGIIMYINQNDGQQYRAFAG